MRIPSTIAEAVEKGAEWGPHGALLRALIVLAATVAIVTTAAVDSTVFLAVLVVVVAATVTVGRPDSFAPLVLIIALLAQWYVGVSPAQPGWSIVLALCVLVIHAAAARASIVPVRAAVDPATTRRWLQHVGTVAGLTIALWALTVALDSRDASGIVAVSVIAVGMVVALTLVLYARDAADEDSQGSPTT